jgi:hypothetical protein
MMSKQWFVCWHIVKRPLNSLDIPEWPVEEPELLGAQGATEVGGGGGGAWTNLLAEVRS